MEFNDCLKRVWWDLLHKHTDYARKEEHEKREKIFALITNLEEVYPESRDWYDENV